VRRLDILGAMRPSYEGVLTEDALSFVGELNDRFAPPRLALLQARADRRKVLAAGEMATGAALLSPTVSTAKAGVMLTGFSGALMGFYAKSPGMRKPGSVWPTASGR